MSQLHQAFQEKKQLPHQDYEQHYPLQDMWITLSTIICSRNVSFGGLLSIWGNLSNMPFTQGSESSGAGNKWPDICEDEMEDQKNSNCLVEKNNTEERHSISLLIGERGKE